MLTARIPLPIELPFRRVHWQVEGTQIPDRHRLWADDSQGDDHSVEPVNPEEGEMLKWR